MSDRRVKYWGSANSERLIHEDPDDAIEDILDGLDNPLPETIEIWGYAPLGVNALSTFPDCQIEGVLEAWEEEYGDPDGYYQVTTTDKMREAEAAFMKVMAEEYAPQMWACEPIEKRVVNVREWISEHRPE